ncbi:tail fiber protein [Cronobacter dublinensis]|nr:tail fiber protein [Cronobacter dublinensis]
MSAGTLSLTNKSDAVLGTGTAFTTDLKPGDFIVFVVGGTGYTLPVKSIASNTQLTLSGSYTGPTQSNISWFAVPREAQSLITAGLASQITEALRGLNADKYNWQQVFSVSDDITVTLPDGTKFTGPSWLKVVDLLKAVDIPALQAIAQQVKSDSDSAGQSKDSAALSAQSASTSASTATTKASEAAQSAQSASTSAATATQKANDASGSASSASSSAATAKTEADRAVAAAGNVDFTMSDVRQYVDSALPVGMMIYWPAATMPDNSSLGIKFLRLNGASFDKSVYKKLAAIYPSGVLPDMRGNVVRGYDDTRGIDSGRDILSEQMDGAPNITGSIAMRMSGAAGLGLLDGTTQSGALYSSGDTQGFTATSASVTRQNILVIDASKSSNKYGTATEIRMRNMSWNMIVRAL